MTRFKLATHTSKRHMVVEVWDAGNLIACIYPGERAMKVISKYPITLAPDTSHKPVALGIEFGERAQ